LGEVLPNRRGGVQAVATVETFKVVAPGLLTNVQDRGRFGYGRYGVAPSGALDSFSLRVANLLVGNPENEACLEITLMGPKLRALTDVAIAVTGADLQASCNDRPLDMWTSWILGKGNTVSFRGLKGGCRSYLAIGGGISLPEVMGSKSTNLSSKFGGLDGGPLRKGNILSSNSPYLHLKTGGSTFPQAWIPPHAKERYVRVILGPQDDQFTGKGKKTFLGTPYQVSPDSDRTGIRLTGPMIERRPEVGESIISEGVVSGTIQVPGDGQPIIILVETVTGGYRKIATVVTADLPLLGQVKPGDTVNFKQVSLDDAYKALRESEGKINRFKEGYSPPP
jgi:antagonist of KipI